MLLSDIGEDSSGLFCLTDRTQCCSKAAAGEGRGLWRFPNGSEVMNAWAQMKFTGIEVTAQSSSIGDNMD